MLVIFSPLHTPSDRVNVGESQRPEPPAEAFPRKPPGLLRESPGNAVWLAALVRFIEEEGAKPAAAAASKAAASTAASDDASGRGGRSVHLRSSATQRFLPLTFS